VSCSSDKTVRIWDASTGAVLNVMKGHTDRSSRLHFRGWHADCVWIDATQACTVWNVSTGTVLNVLKGHTDSVKSVAFSMDGKRIVSGS
jgi:WD40 repeat protein